MPNWLRRMRGTLGNIVTWGVSWVVLGTGATLVLRATGIDDAPITVLGVVIAGLKIGVGGLIAGAAFSGFIAYAYRDRRLDDISWVKFGLAGAAATAASILCFVNGASLLSGSGFVPWRYAESTLALFSVLGFGAAAASVRLAQMAAPTSSSIPPLGETTMTKKRSAKVPNFGAAPKQVGAKNALPPAQQTKAAPTTQSVKPRATSAKSGHRGK